MEMAEMRRGDLAEQAADDFAWSGRPALAVIVLRALPWVCGALIIAVASAPLGDLLQRELQPLLQQAFPLDTYRMVMMGVVAVLIFIGMLQALALLLTRYRLGQGQLVTDTGILGRHSEMMELYRVRDVSLERPFHLLVLGLGTIVLHTEDRTMPVQRLYGLPCSRALCDRLRVGILQARGTIGIVGLE